MVITDDSNGKARTGLNPTGLRKRPSYEEAINYLQTDQEIIRYPIREAKQTRESPWMTQLDPDGNDDVINKINNEQLMNNTLRQMAAHLGQARGQVAAHIRYGRRSPPRLLGRRLWHARWGGRPCPRKSKHQNRT